MNYSTKTVPKPVKILEYYVQVRKQSMEGGSHMQEAIFIGALKALCHRVVTIQEVMVQEVCLSGESSLRLFIQYLKDENFKHKHT